MDDMPSFLAVSLLALVTPGQDTALTIRNTSRGGRSAGVFTAIGVSTGQLAWAFAASCGVGALLATSERALASLRVTGSAYLVVLGGRGLVHALSDRDSTALASVERTTLRSTPSSALRQGLVSNLTNPKMLAFFTGVLPQYVSSVVGMYVFGLASSVLTLAWLALYAWLIGRWSEFLLRRNVRRSVEALTSTGLVAVGLSLLLEGP